VHQDGVAVVLGADLGFRDQGLGFGVKGLRYRVRSLGFRGWGQGSRIEGLACSV